MREEYHAGVYVFPLGEIAFRVVSSDFADFAEARTNIAQEHSAIVTTSVPHPIRALCLLFLLACGSAAGFGLGVDKPLKQYGRQSWQSDTGLPQNTVQAIAQTRDGFLWLGTQSGLVRFDGQEFRTYDKSTTPALPGDSIEGLAVDGRGVLWINCAGSLLRLDHGQFRPVLTSAKSVRIAKVLRNGDLLIVGDAELLIGGETGLRTLAGSAGVSAEKSGDLVAEGPEGQLWFASGRELVSISEKTGALRFPVPGIGTLQVVAAGPQGEVWVGGREGLALFRNGKRMPVALRASVTAILAAPDGEAWVGTDRGLLHSHAGRLEPVATAGRVERLFRDREGAVWVAFSDRVSRIGRDGLLQEAIDLPEVLSILEDTEGDMWFGTEAGGATVLREQAFSSLTVQDGLSDDFVRAVFQDHAGRAWVGTNRGGLNLIQDGRATAMKSGKPGALASNVVLALAEAGSDLWVGTPDGLNRLYDGKFELFTTANGLPDDFVRSLYTDRDGSLWIGTRGGLSNLAQGRFTSYSALDGLGSDLIGSILRAHDGTLWVGTLGGVSRFNGTEFKNFTQRDGLGGDAITALAEDSEGTIWIASHGAGLTRLRGGRFQAMAPSSASLPPEIYSLLEDQQKNLWMGTAKGVYRAPLAALNAMVEGHTDGFVEHFGVADGMKISECSSGGRPAGWRMRDGSLWFATLKGVAAVRPGIGMGSRKVPAASIEEVAIDDRMTIGDPGAGDGAQLVVPAGRERLTIHYAAPSFQAPQKVVFRYKLEGFDRDWIVAGSRRTAYYTNIPAGAYRFLVAASNGDGAWSETAGELKILIKPRFYRTWWFYLLLAVLIASVAYGVYRLRVRSVEASYRAITGERNRIAREIHDTLAQGYVGVSLQLEMVSRMLKASRSQGSEAGPIEGLVESTKELVRSSLEEARSSIWKLRSSQADAEAETLPARLTTAVRAKQEGFEAPIRLTVTGTFRPLEQSAEDEMLRIAQEAISNAIRHASATAIDVLLKYDTGGLLLRVSDDGSGFHQDGESRRGHYGLQGMRERALAIGAKLRIVSNRGAGTSVEASLTTVALDPRPRQEKDGVNG